MRCTSSCAAITHAIVSRPVSFEGNPEDPLLRAEIAKRDKAREALSDEAAENEPTEHQVERDSTEKVEAAVEKTTVSNNEDEAASSGKALAKEVVTVSLLLSTS